MESNDVVRLDLVRVPVSTLARFLEAVAAHPHEDLAPIARYVNMSESSARRALHDLEQLGLVSRGEGGTYTSSTSGLGRGVGEDVLRRTIRSALLSNRPFELLCEGLSLGEEAEEATRKASVLLGLNADDVASLDVLLGWGKELGIVVADERGGLVLAGEFDPTTSPEPGLPTSEEVASGARARLYVAKRIGRDANNYLDDVDRQLLEDALLKASTDPQTAIEDSGRAIENFLREVAADKGLATEASKKNGAAQLASLLRQHSVIHVHHLHLVMAIATLRNSQGHSKDKRTNTIWISDTQTAYWAAQGALVVIRSIHAFVYEGRQVL